MIGKSLISLALLGVLMSVNAKEVVLDLRTPAEIADTGIVQGAVAVNFKAPDFAERLEALNLKSDDEIYAYCRTGRRVSLSMPVFEDLGLKNVTNLGGYERASRVLGRPLVK